MDTIQGTRATAGTKTDKPAPGTGSEPAPAADPGELAPVEGSPAEVVVHPSAERWRSASGHQRRLRVTSGAIPIVDGTRRSSRMTPTGKPLCGFDCSDGFMTSGEIGYHRPEIATG